MTGIRNYNTATQLTKYVCGTVLGGNSEIVSEKISMLKFYMKFNKILNKNKIANNINKQLEGFQGNTIHPQEIGRSLFLVMITIMLLWKIPSKK